VHEQLTPQSAAADGDAPTPFRRLLVPLGATGDDQVALPVAVAMAQAAGGEITLLATAEAEDPRSDQFESVASVIVEPLGAYPAGPGEGPAPEVRERERRPAAHRARELLREAAEHVPEGVTVHRHVGWGPAAQVVVEAAGGGGQDAIVLATRRRRPVDEAVHGHVARHVLRHATVPVVLVQLPAPA
jgi:nucleotide-binding universal stress UspA family protein